MRTTAQCLVKAAEMERLAGTCQIPAIRRTMKGWQCIGVLRYEPIGRTDTILAPQQIRIRRLPSGDGRI